MRVLWYSNSPAPTGYGEQTRLIIERLARDGHAVAVASNYGTQAEVKVYQVPNVGPVPLLPQGADGYSSDILPAHYRAWTGPDANGWLITLYDVWPLKIENVRGKVPHIASWVPVDHAPAPPETVRWFRETGAVPIAMSEFGQAMLRGQNIADVRYIPHAIDLGTWRPREAFPNGQTAKEALGFPADSFLVFINAANKGQWPPRKAWSENLTALALFMRANPDVYAYVHTESTGVAHGIDLEVLAKAGGIDPARLRFADRYAYSIGHLTSDDIAVYQSAADVTLLASMGEGFGLPAAEGLAVGTPSIVSDFSAQPEIVGDTGWLVDGQPWWDALHSAYFFMPFIDSIIARLEEAYAERGTPAAAERRLRCRARAEERYDVELVYANAWRPLLVELESRLGPIARPTVPDEPRPMNRAERRAARKAAVR